VATLPKVRIKEDKRFKMATARWQGAAWHEAQASADQGKNPKMATATRKRESTPILELLTFSGNRETREDRRGTKYIRATDLLKEMTRRRAANPDWDDAAAIRHCARSFRTDVAVWLEEVIPSDNSPKQLKKINTSLERFKASSDKHG
jgi:hypothetical protein